MSGEEAARVIANIKKRRGVVRSSLTKLATKTGEIESSESALKRERAERAMTRLSSLEKEFRTLHYQLIDQLDEEEDLLAQQEVLDQAEEDIATLGFRLSQLTKSATPTTPDHRERRILSKRLAHMQWRF